MAGPWLTRRLFLLAGTAFGGIAALSKDAFAFAAPLVIASEDYPPYAFNVRGRREGFDVEKVAMVLEALKYRPVQRSMPRTPLFKGLEDATVDLGFPFTETPLRKQKYLISGKLHTNRTVLAVRTEDAKEPLTLASLAGLRVGTTDRHRYPAEFDALTNITRVGSSSLNLAIRRLSYGRVDAVIGDLSAMEATAYSEGLEHKIHVSHQVISAVPAYALFPKSRAAFAAEFGDMLAKLDAAGKFKEIEAKYPAVEPPR